MKQTFLAQAPMILETLASTVIDGISLSKPIEAMEYADGPLMFIACGFPELLDSNLRALIFKPIEGLEFLCHVRFSFRPCSGTDQEMHLEFDYKTLSNILCGTGVRTIDTAGKAYFFEFFDSMDGELMDTFRNKEPKTRLAS